MPTLKAYIEQVALRLGSASGSPKLNSVIDIGADITKETTYIAPKDGFISIVGSFAKSSWSSVNVRHGGDFRFCSGLSSTVDAWFSGSVPTRKGDSVLICPQGIGKINAYFIPSVGGGA